MDNKTKLEEAAMKAITPAAMAVAISIDLYRRKVRPMIKR